MSKIHGTNVHILPDENLGGVLREYVEVDRKAKDGDYVSTRFGIHIVSDYNHSEIVAGDLAGYYSRVFKHGDYKTLEPTNIIRLREGRYRLVDRKAKVGEKVVVFDHSNENGNGIFTVYDVYVVNDAISYAGKDGKYYGASSKNYRVLEPVEPTELVTAEEGDDKSILDLLANLARRVTELERKLDGIVDLKRKEYDAYEKLFTGIDEKIEMLIDDVAMLDERTQPLATKKPSVAVAVRSIQQEFDGVFTKTEIDAYVESEGFCLNGTFEFKGSVKGPNDAAEKISEVFK
jgi:hypothetical protein